MADARLEPRPSMPTYAVRAPLAAWLREEARDAHAALGPYRLLDIGCGEKPYEPIFAPYVSSYVGVDPVDNPRAEVKGAAEALPLDDGCSDVTICIQVLEHVEDPAAVVRELHRVTAPGGRVLLSTHGVMVFHPNPVDRWRWTHQGLEKLFADAGEWASVRVTPSSGTTACLAMLTSIYLDHVLRRLRLARLMPPLVSIVNRVGAAIDRRQPLLAGTRPGTLTANYHVVAERRP
ncbi:MAG: class I SAM-dependent methyltransferase [Gaiellales bacterium]